MYFKEQRREDKYDGVKSLIQNKKKGEQEKRRNETPYPYFMAHHILNHKESDV